MRKSPYRHDVSEHMRKGKLIGAYKRGKGPKPRTPVKKGRIVEKKDTKFPYSNFRLVIKYEEQDVERLTVGGKAFASAIELGLSKRESVEKPVSVKIVGLK